jgi:starvation-inducible DNA-binding protein
MPTTQIQPITENPLSSPSRFIASDTLVHSLQSVLVDLLELTLQGKQAHWNVVGPNFADVHRQLDLIVTTARDAADGVAERMRSVGGTPDGLSATVAETTGLRAYPRGEVTTRETIDLISDRIYATVANARAVHTAVDEDPASADLLTGTIAQLEQQAWLLSSENRTPSS